MDGFTAVPFSEVDVTYLYADTRLPHECVPFNFMEMSARLLRGLKQSGEVILPIAAGFSGISYDASLAHTAVGPL